MKKTISAVTMAILLMCSHNIPAQTDAGLTHAKKMDWWADARFGMFIHWGVYAQFAGQYQGRAQKIADGAWLLNRMKVPVQVYKEEAKKFNPINYNPELWVKTAKDAGMKYIVITAKHHDGFALFDSKASDWDIADATIYKKDLLKPLAEACRKQGMKLGFYYSQEQDWGNPGGAAHRRATIQGWENPDSAKIDAYTLAHNGHWDPVQSTKTFSQYMDNVAIPQIKELLANYGDIAIIWWDTPYFITDEQAQRVTDLFKKYPNVITNDRLHKKFPGDFKTPEQKIPNLAELDGEKWETCMTMNNSWGYRSDDKHWKSSETLIRNLIDVASKGGNYLLNVGPKADGTFPAESINSLKEIGSWMKTYNMAIYGTHANPVSNVNWGRITAKDNKNATTLFLSVFDWPANGILKMDGVNAKAVSANLTGAGKALKIMQKDGVLELSGLPAIAPNQFASVIEVTFDQLIAKKKFTPQKKMKVGALD